MTDLFSAVRFGVRDLPPNMSKAAAVPLSCCQSQSQNYITTYGRSASMSWNKAPIWSLRPDLYYFQTVAGLSFTFAAGPRQRSHFRVRVPWDS
jgi:hypothetical protein